jgi:hypothetical protein
MFIFLSILGNALQLLFLITSKSLLLNIKCRLRCLTIDFYIVYRDTGKYLCIICAGLCRMQVVLYTCNTGVTNTTVIVSLGERH